MKTYDIAVVGATGAVGETLLSILEERNFPVGTVYALASERSLHKQVPFKNGDLQVQNLAEFDFSQVQIALFSAGGSVSAQYVPIAAETGCCVIDNTSHFRYEDDIPLVIPEVNGHALAHYTNRHIIANPNCSTIQMLVALKPIYDAVGIDRINVCTYQSVSGAGKNYIETLARQTADLLNATPLQDVAHHAQIAFNALPKIDQFEENGYTREEMKMVWETQKIFEDEQILVNPTCVRIPVFYGHSEALHIETRERIELAQVRELLDKAPGVTLIDAPEADLYPTAIGAAGGDDVYVGRVRQDVTNDRGLNLWVVSDNIRKGAALNSVQIAEQLIRDYL